MAPRSERRRTAATLLVALLVVGTGVAVTGATTSDAGTAPDTESAAEGTAAVQDQQENVSVRNLSAPDQVQTGTEFTVSATVVNPSNASVTNRVSYQIAGNLIEARLVNVSANDSETVRFDVAANATEGFPTGTFTHGVYTEGSNVTANLTLTAPGEAPEETTTPEATTTTPEETTTTPEGTTTTPNETTTTPSETTATPEETATPEAQTASLTFEDQTSNGSAVTVQSVTVPEGGFVVIHDNGVVEGEVVESILGQSDYLEPGTSENVTVELNQTLNQSQRLVAVVYRDSNDNQTFDFVTSNRRADGSYTKPDSREAVNSFAVIDVQEETGNETDDGTA